MANVPLVHESVNNIIYLIAGTTVWETKFMIAQVTALIAPINIAQVDKI